MEEEIIPRQEVKKIRLQNYVRIIQEMIEWPREEQEEFPEE